jgi:hypothetical protein
VAVRTGTRGRRTREIRRREREEEIMRVVIRRMKTIEERGRIRKKVGMAIVPVNGRIGSTRIERGVVKTGNQQSDRKTVKITEQLEERGNNRTSILYVFS